MAMYVSERSYHKRPVLSGAECKAAVMVHCNRRAFHEMCDTNHHDMYSITREDPYHRRLTFTQEVCSASLHKFLCRRFTSTVSCSSG